MFDIGWSELLVIGVVALIVVGPKDLPRMFRTLGEFTGKARRMAREFQHAMNEAADESGVGDITKDLRKMANPKKYGTDVLKDATGDLSAWSPDAPDGKAKPGPSKAGLSKDRAATKAKIEQATAARAQARRDAEVAERSAGPKLQPDPEAPPPAPEAKS
ncbi:Sec-independent protein translocase protein TatB [uncultured Jannaschia sp.]|uniref:Sec-independent protein translocase protein TatB n=1 Tax=uncultured Jannaschia sp. TaxID=293347 RepID=UPI00261EA0DD|nr:Sec-independent protein translocase protein TatB [uncultured Jannaschia sp.]